MKYSLLLLILAFQLSASSQEAKRHTIATSGNSAVISHGQRIYYVQSSIGQASVIGHGSSEFLDVRQGFIQPLSAKFIRISDSSDLDVVVYPNPFRTEFNIQFEEPLNSEILLFDLTGRLLKKLEFNELDLVLIEVPELPSGTYMVHVRSTNKSYIGKIIKY